MPQRHTVRDCMTPLESLLGPDDTVADAIRFLRRTRLDLCPVADAGGRLAGVLTRSRLYDHILAGGPLEAPLHTVCTRQVFSVSASYPLDYASVIRLTLTSPVGSGPVLDEDGRVVGVFTKLDLITYLFEQAEDLGALLSAVLTAMPSGTAVLDGQGRIILANPAFGHLTGRPSGELAGLALTEVIPGFPLDQVLADPGRVVGLRFPVGDRITLVSASRFETPADTLPAVGHLSPGRDVRAQGRNPAAGGGPDPDRTGVVAIFQDITEVERQSTELQSVRRAQQLLSTVLENAYDGIVMVDEAGRITYVNRALCDLFDLEPDSVLGQPVGRVLPDFPLGPGALGAPEMTEVRTKKGVQYVVSTVPVVIDGRPAGAIGKVFYRHLEQVREVARRLSALRGEVALYREELRRAAGGSRWRFEDILTRNPALQRIIQSARKAARGRSTILIRGESGTGKELFAHAIHAASPRAAGPFVTVNCAAIPEHLLESEFFGYAPGAFTGASSKGRLGKFDLADGGTLFLDEIGDMSPHLQAKLLRVLQEGEFYRVGGVEPVRVDVRIIAATNQPLEEKVARGEFRADLLYRLNVIAFTLPPLRERPEDVEVLARRFIAELNPLLGTTVAGVSEAALEAMRRYPWPGNVRELRNVIERAMVFCESGEIGPDDLPEAIAAAVSRSGLAVGPEQEGPAHTAGPPRIVEAVEAAEREAILAALRQSGGNRVRAARLLGMSRSAFYQRLRRYRLLGGPS